ncbi:MAG: TPM domain-containing protein [Clostridia bacterium]|nr:TPM domain-containing protein [Clostridia bacterium]
MKKLFSILTALMIFCFSAASVMAEGRLVNDEADVLTADEQQELEARLSEIADAYDFDPVILFTPDSGNSIVAYADDYFDNNGYGRGDRRSGVIMVMDVTYNKRYISTSGDCVNAYTDDVISYIGNDLRESANERDYYNLSKKFASYAEDIMSSYRSKGRYITPYHIETKTLAVILIVVLIISLIVMGKAKKSTKEAVTPVDADIYTKNGSANITAARDLFLYSNITRTARSENKGGRGSSTHTSSSGRTHGGGSF